MNDDGPPSPLLAHTRRLTRQVTAVQSASASPLPLFHPRRHPASATYPRRHDSFDLHSHPATLPLSPTLLASHVERAVVAAVPVYAGLVDHVARLATWRDPPRTLMWSTTYALCWHYNVLLPTALACVVLGCVYPEGTAAALFPPEPHARIEAPAEALAEEVSSFVATVVPSEEETPSPTTSPRPILLEHGATAQKVIGDVADLHERWRNLFLRRHSRSRNGFPPNIRLALSVLPFLVASLTLSTRVLCKLLGLCIGILLFALHPAMQVSQTLRDGLDQDQTVLRDVPTDRAWTLARLREVKETRGLSAALDLIAKAQQSEPTNATPLALERDTSESSGERPRKRDKLAAMVKSSMQTADQATSILTGTQPMTLDSIVSLLPTAATSFLSNSNSNPSTATTATYSSSTSRQQILATIGPSLPLLDGPDDVGGIAYFGYCNNNVPGHLIITNMCVRFESVVSISLRTKPKKVLFRFALRDLIGVRKTAMLRLPGVWSGLHGLELVQVNGHRWIVGNIMKRDEAFWHLILIQQWDDQSQGGWITV